MSWNCYLNDPQTGERIMLDDLHHLRGGSYAAGGTREAWLNVTYNYSEHIVKAFTEAAEGIVVGLDGLSGRTAHDTIPFLASAIASMQPDTVASLNYWDATEGNARGALIDLLSLARMAPHGVWEVT